MLRNEDSTSHATGSRLGSLGPGIEGLSALIAGGRNSNAAIMRPDRKPIRQSPGNPRRLLFRSRSPSDAQLCSASVPPGQFHVDDSSANALALDDAVAALEPYMREKMIPTGRVINPLLDVWSVARGIHPTVALPVEGLLTALISRSATTPPELVAALDEVRIAAVQANVFANAVA